MSKPVERGFTEFVTERGHALLRVAYALTGDQHAAQDLVQDALAKAFPPPPGNTGLRSPAADAAGPGGDGNGFQTGPTNAYADDGLSPPFAPTTSFARKVSTGNSPSVGASAASDAEGGRTGAPTTGRTRSEPYDDQLRNT